MGEEEDRDTEKTLNTVPGYNIPLNMLTNIFSMSSATYFEKRLKSIRQYLSPQDAKSQFDSFCDILRHTTGVATSPFCCNVKNCDNIYRLISLIDSESLVTSQQAIIVLTNLVGQSGAQSSISPNQIVSEPETIDTKQTISPEYFKSTDIIIAQYKTFTRPKTIRRIPKPSFSVRGAFASRLNSSANSYINAGCMLGVSDEASYSIRVLSLSETWRTTILHSPFLANIKKCVNKIFILHV